LPADFAEEVSSRDLHPLRLATQRGGQAGPAEITESDLLNLP
jgi:hypothetical protein